MFRFGYILGTCLTFAVLVSSHYFPSDIEQCVYSDSVCLSRVAMGILRMHSKGHPGLNIVPIDPLHADSLVLKKIPGSPVNVDFNFTNIDLIGISQGIVINMTGFPKEPSDFVLEMHVNYPKFIMSAQYSCDGTVFHRPIKGQGNSKITFDDILFNARAKCSTRQVNGKTYIYIADVDVDLQPKKVTFVFENLFNGFKVKKAAKMNKLLNDNWQTVFGELEPLLGKGFTKIGAIVVNGTFSKIPYADLFLKVE